MPGTWKHHAQTDDNLGLPVDAEQFAQIPVGGMTQQIKFPGIPGHWWLYLTRRPDRSG